MHVWCTEYGQYKIPPEIYYGIVWEHKALGGKLAALVGYEPTVYTEPAPLPQNQEFWDWVAAKDREWEEVELDS